MGQTEELRLTMIEATLEIIPAIRLRKARALLFFLVAEPARSHRVEKILDLLWQDASAEKASNSCRQVVRDIRLVLDRVPGVQLMTGGSTLSLTFLGTMASQSGLVGVLARLPAEPRNMDRVRGLVGVIETLEGISPSFDSWLAIVSSGLMTSIRQSLDSHLSASGLQPEVGSQIAEFALELEPANEKAVRFLMRQNWQSGHATRAMELYNRLYVCLDEQFDQEPEPETIALLAAIKLDPTGGGAVAPVVVKRPQVSLAIRLLPDTLPNREMASFAAVLHADLRMRMGRFREWRLVEDDQPEAVPLVVVLRPLMMQDEFRLFVELQQGSERHLLWAEEIVEPSRNWEAKARVLLTNIAQALSVVVADRSLSDTASAVYDRWLRAQALLDAWSPATESTALTMLREITLEAPRFGPAHAELAGALNVRHVLLPGTRQTDEVRQSALHHATEAVSIDPLDTRAHRVLAWCYCHKGEFSLAEFHFEQALALNRSNPLTLASASLGFAFTHDLARAAELAAEARLHAAVMEPFHLIYLAATDYLCGAFDRAAEQCVRGAGLMTTVGGWHSAALWQLGRKSEARQRFAVYMDEIRGQWRGPQPPDQIAVIDWFTAIFPLRHEPAGASLRATLIEVAR